jgi:hypothetical protein
MTSFLDERIENKIVFCFFCNPLNKQTMQLMNGKPSGLRESHEGIVEVKLWEAFLLYNRHNLYNTLSTYAIENGPVEKENTDQATVSFRFTAYDWHNTIKKMLHAQNIPVIREKAAVEKQATVWHTN